MFPFDKEAIIVCDEGTKKHILRLAYAEKRFFNYTFYSLTEFRDNFYFKLTKRAFALSAKFLNCSYENSLVIAPNIYYVDLNTKYADEKLIQLQSLKKLLFEQHMLETNELFLSLLARKKVYLLKPKCLLNVFDSQMFSEVEKLTEVIYYEADFSLSTDAVAEFMNYEQEVEYVFQQIRMLLDSGIDINKIYIVNEDRSYYHLLRRYSYLFDIPISIQEKQPIIAHSLVKEFLSFIKAGLSYEKALEEVQASVNFNEEIYRIIVNTINEYSDITEIIPEILAYAFAKKSYPTKTLTDAVKVVGIAGGFADDEYVFVMNFTNGNLPKLFIDDLYLGDKYALILPVTSTQLRNEIAVNDAIFMLSKIKKIVISFAHRTNEEKMSSTLIGKLGLKLVKPKVHHNFSSKLASLRLGKELDDFINFGVHKPSLDALYSSFDDMYKKFDNQFDFVDSDLLYKKLNGKISLSYSTISDYYKCSFYYFLNRVLKIATNDDTRAADLGTIFHSILENYHKSDFSLDDEYKKAQQLISDNTQLFYFEKLWPDFLLMLDFIDETKDLTMLEKECHEDQIELEFAGSKYLRRFNGFIDKIIYQTIDGIDYLAIIDYKTGNTQSSSLDNINYGFNLQLPVYAYLIAKSKIFHHPQLLGIYLQHVFADIEYKSNKPIAELKRQGFELDGYSIDNQRLLSLLDRSYANSRMIKNMATSKNGSFYQRSKVISQEGFNKLVEIVEGLVDEAFIAIEKGDFPINPKYIKDINKSCKYCPYGDICYQKPSNKVIYEETKIETILGGDE